MRELIRLATHRSQQLVDITEPVQAVVERSGIAEGLVHVYAQDGNGDAHLKAGLVGPSETIPLIEGKLGLSRWQNICFCEFDVPRHDRTVVVTVLADH